MLDEFVAGVAAMPLWAQIGMGWFVLCVAVMFAEPIVRLRRVARRFASLAAASGSAVTPGHDKFTASFDVDCAGRRFTVRRELREGSSRYRGPRGHLLVCETPLTGTPWQRHDVDIANEGSLPARGMFPFRTGDAAFDQRFTAWQGGQPVRPGWLDAATRNAVSAFFDAAPTKGSLWVRAGMLQYLAVVPKGMGPDNLATVLRTLAMVAQVFERTAAA